jgi:hypothetical protein
MYNDYYLLKRIEDKEGELSFASAMDSFTYKGEVVQEPIFDYNGKLDPKLMPQVGDKVIFLKGSGEDVGEFKAVQFNDIIMKI